MDSTSYILGIDVGSVSIHIALIDNQINFIHTSSAYNYGEVKQCLKKQYETGLTAQYQKNKSKTDKMNFIFLAGHRLF